MGPTVFAVNDEPYCLWDVDINERNQQFLTGLDPDYFEYNLAAHGVRPLGGFQAFLFRATKRPISLWNSLLRRQPKPSENERRSSIAIRTAYHHSVETLFSLLGAFVQAPTCGYAWIGRCSNTELRTFVRRVSAGDGGLFTKLKISEMSWHEIARCVFLSYKPGTQAQALTIEQFSSLWERLAAELTDQPTIDEYNAIKHGFRIRGGGFSISIGKEEKYGVPAPESAMESLGGSEFGSSFFKIETLGTGKENRSIRSRRTAVNWSLERLMLLSQLTYFSINNVVSGLRVANGWQAGSCKFLRPADHDAFDRPWRYSSGVSTINIDFVLDETNSRAVTKAELLPLIKPPRQH